jgi:tetratricopeptide (TPR) repeat protein
VKAGSDAAERDRRMLDRLVDIRSAKSDDPDGNATDAAYADAFKERGIDLTALPPAAAGKQIKARPPATAQALAVALDDWAAVRWRRRGDRPGAQRLSEAARVADPNPWRRDLRAALYHADSSAGLTALQAAARSARFDALGAVSLDLLGTALDSSGDPATAETVLRSAQRRHPEDVWINYDLAQVCEKRNPREDAVRFYTAARSIRPETAHELAHLLEQKGESDEAVAVFHDLARLRPRNARHLACLGRLLRALGRPAEAGPFLDAAVGAGREAIRFKPDFAPAHVGLANALNAQGNFDEAIAETREAIRLQPNDAGAHTNLGLILSNNKQDYDAATAEFRTAIRLLPDAAIPHGSLGNALKAQGKVDEAVAEYRTAIRLKPDDALAHNNLGAILCDDKHDYDAAIAEFRTAIQLKPDDASAHSNLGNALKAQGKLELAIVAYHEAIQLQPAYAAAHNSLGNALSAQGKLDEAIAEYREVIRLSPSSAATHKSLALALRRQGKLEDALSALRRAGALANPGTPLARDLPGMIRQTERMIAVADRLAAVLNGEDQPRDGAEVETFVLLCRDQERYAAAARLLADALAADPKLADDLKAAHRYNAACSAALAAAGKGEEAATFDDPERARLRKQAHDWLRADLALWTRSLEPGTPAGHAAVQNAMRHWQHEPDLAGIRDPEALARLPEAERKECEALWAEVQALIDRARKSGGP